MSRPLLVSAVLLSTVLVMRYPRPADPFAATERARVRTHLDSAERELRAAPVTGLTLSQRAARERALDRLHEYWVRGVFPQNTDFPNERVPYFIDRNGTRCAMAHLIEESGHGAFVARVAATRNNARIAELSGDPQLIAWLGENGMELAEAARIQPEYCYTHPCSDPMCGPCPPVTTGYKVATGLSVGVDVLTIALNVWPTRLSPTLTGVLGIGSGVVGMAIGIPELNEAGSQHTLAAVNAGMGAVAAAVGVYSLTGKRSTGTPVGFAPWFSTNGASGVSGRITF